MEEKVLSICQQAIVNDYLADYLATLGYKAAFVRQFCIYGWIPKKKHQQETD